MGAPTWLEFETEELLVFVGHQPSFSESPCVKKISQTVMEWDKWNPLLAAAHTHTYTHTCMYTTYNLCLSLSFSLSIS